LSKFKKGPCTYLPDCLRDDDYTKQNACRKSGGGEIAIISLGRWGSTYAKGQMVSRPKSTMGMDKVYMAFDNRQ
jgi:hypothetical protein